MEVVTAIPTGRPKRGGVPCIPPDTPPERRDLRRPGAFRPRVATPISPQGGTGQRRHSQIAGHLFLEALQGSVRHARAALCHAKGAQPIVDLEARLPLQAALLHQAVEQFAACRFPREIDDLLVDEFAWVHVVRAGQSVSGGADEREPRADHRLETHTESSSIDPGSDRKVHMAVEHQVGHGDGVRAQQAHFDARVPLVELADGVADVDAPREGRGYGDANRAHHQIACLSDSVLGPVHLLERGAGRPDSTCPASVSSVPRRPRMNRSVLSSRSSARSEADRLDCTMNRRAAARVNKLFDDGQEVFDLSEFHTSIQRPK